jgi:hypothetical protein
MAIEVFEDDLVGVPDEAVLYRRVDWDKIGGKAKYPPGEIGKINSNCFTDYPAEKATDLGYPGPCMSVGVSTVLQDYEHEPSKMLEGFSDYGLACVTAGDLRKLTRGDGEPRPQGIMLSPTDDEPWHGVVFDLIDLQRSNATRKAVARIAAWEIALIGQ